MKTYVLGGEEIHAYLLDFLQRLQHIDPAPTVWCSITESGEKLVQSLLDLVAVKYPDMLSGF